MYEIVVGILREANIRAGWDLADGLGGQERAFRPPTFAAASKVQ